MKRNSYGAGIADKPVKRTEQKHCACGAPVAARKARCWDCEDKLHTARRNERRSRNRSGAADSCPAKAPGDRGALGKRDTRRALARLDMTAIVAVVDSAGPVLALRVTGDPDALLRQFKSCNPRVAGLALSLWCDNEVVARRIGQAAREILERAGHGREGSWLGCTVSQLDAVLRRVAGEMGSRWASGSNRNSGRKEELAQEATNVAA